MARFLRNCHLIACLGRSHFNAVTGELAPPPVAAAVVELADWPTCGECKMPCAPQDSIVCACLVLAPLSELNQLHHMWGEREERRKKEREEREREGERKGTEIDRWTEKGEREHDRERERERESLCRESGRLVEMQLDVTGFSD